MNVLVVTNGHGEDRLALCLVQALLQRQPALHIRAVPLVGEGQLLAEAGLAVDGPRVRVPSGGLVRPTAAAVWRDLRAGLVGQFRRQMAFLRNQAGWAHGVIAVGDAFAGWVAGRSLPGRSLILVATAKSAYIHGHSRLEARWMRRRLRHVFTRDEPTAEQLRQWGVPASWQGNLMMDALEFTGRRVASPGETPVLALLPGSRADAYANLGSLADCLERLRKAGSCVLGLVPLAPGLDQDQALAVLADRGWTAAGPGFGGEAAPDRGGAGGAGPGPDGDGPPSGQAGDGLHLGLEGGAHGPPFATVEKPGVRLRLTRGVFGDVLQAADVVVGLAGTANEQAAGLGKPVVAFPGPGVQFGPRFLRAQKRLLGDALAVVAPDPEAVAAEVRLILQDEARRARMAAIGRERMGPPGAAARMAAAIARIWDLDRSKDGEGASGP